MRTAVLADVHGNLPALHVVLTLDGEPVDTIVVARRRRRRRADA
jgi:hypothetical protein